MNDRNNQTERLYMMDLVIISYVGVGQNFSLFIHHACDASAPLTKYFFLGSGKLDPQNIRKTHSISILAFSKGVGLG